MDVPLDTNIWSVKTTNHYIINYKNNSLAAKDIEDIASYQEQCYQEITSTLEHTVENPITYYLCDSKSEVKSLSETDYECNEVIVLNDIENPVIYAVYNEDTKSIGAHEDTHAIASQIAQPASQAIVEGLATCFDKSWNGVAVELCTSIYLEDGRYISVADMIVDDEYFAETECDIAYPIIGAFTRYLIDKYGIDLYKQLYTSTSDWEDAFVDLYGQTIADVEDGFIETIRDTEYTEEEVKEAQDLLNT